MNPRQKSSGTHGQEGLQPVTHEAGAQVPHGVHSEV